MYYQVISLFRHSTAGRQMFMYDERPWTRLHHLYVIFYAWPEIHRARFPVVSYVIAWQACIVIARVWTQYEITMPFLYTQSTV